jgi:hypothetical protein
VVDNSTNSDVESTICIDIGIFLSSFLLPLPLPTLSGNAVEAGFRSECGRKECVEAELVNLGNRP